jgi:hypothetical protein
LKSIAVVALIIIIIIVLVALKRSQSTPNEEAIQTSLPQMNIKSITFDSTPDLPSGFGYKCQWFVVKTIDYSDVAKFLKLKDITVANWETGITGAYEGYYFVSPPLEGWTFIVNAQMPDISDNSASGPTEMLQNLSNKYGEAYYFGSHRVANYTAWAKAIKGGITRSFGYADGEEIVNSGTLTMEEKQLGLIFSDDSNIPDEESVISIASKWTVSPLMDSNDYKPGTGLVGIIQ